jgi:hypothetical protein
LAGEREAGWVVMGLFVLEMVFRGLGLRGHTPQFGDYYSDRSGVSSLAGSAVARIVAGFLASVACLALALWLAVWLAIRLL